MPKETNSVGAYMAEYAENTTIHGIKYLGEKQRPIAEKIFWIIAFAVSFIFLGFFVQDLSKKFNQKSAILVENDRPTPIHEIPFPAVTICPTVKIRSEFLPVEETIKWIKGKAEKSMILDLAYLLCNQQLVYGLLNPINITQYLNQSHIELLHKISPTIDESFMYAEFPSKKSAGKNRIFPFSYILTNEGICFTFNVPSELIADEPSLQTEYEYHNIPNKMKSWNYEHGYYGYPRFPRSIWGSGSTSGLYFTLIAKESDLNTICQPTEIGYKILLHSPDEYPTTLEEFISIPHNTMAQIKVTPKITKTSNDLSKLNPQVRQCFFDHERKLKFFTYYNRVNCKLECLANYTLQQYGCVHFSLPRNNSQPICGPGIQINEMFDTEETMNSYFQFQEIITERYEMELEDDELIDFKILPNFHCDCLPACNSVEYEYRVKIENIEIEKINKKMYPNEKSNAHSAAIIEIFFGITKVTGMTRKQYYTFTDLISNIGGLVGLFMGASILSIFEIIYFLIVR